MSAALDLDRLSVVLVSPRNPLNIGAAARAMSNFGFSRLRIVSPYELAFREARSAVGASALLKKAEKFNSLAEAIADCSLVVGTTAARNRELRHPLHRLDAAAKIVRKRLSTGRVALLFGSEKRGLSNRDLSSCHWLVRIPTREDHPSMNLGQAVACCLYELARTPAKSLRGEEIGQARAADLERITEMLFRALIESGYVAARSQDSSRQKLRRLVRRLEIPAADTGLWMGMLRQLLWKLSTSRAR